MHLQILVTGLDAPPEAMQGLALPALERLLARGRRAKPPAPAWESVEPWLLARFGVAREADWPSAPHALRGEGGEPGDAYWTHADPVHLAAGNDRLSASAGEALALTRDEADALVAALNAHFAPAMTIEAPAPARWYARVAAPPEGPTRSLPEYAGHEFEAPAPGSPGIGWHALMNEAQMLLHAQPVNEAREARGALPVNGIWLWGGGRAAATPSAGTLRRVHADAPLAAGLARAAGIAHGVLPEAAGGFAGEGVELVLFDRLERARMTGGPDGGIDAWRETLLAFERDWAVPLLDALARARIGMLSLLLPVRGRLVTVETVRTDLPRFWRRPRPLAAQLDRLTA